MSPSPREREVEQNRKSFELAFILSRFRSPLSPRETLSSEEEGRENSSSTMQKVLIRN